jgi:hypothetical protein
MANKSDYQSKPRLWTWHYCYNSCVVYSCNVFFPSLMYYHIRWIFAMRSRHPVQVSLVFTPHLYQQHNSHLCTVHKQLWNPVTPSSHRALLAVCFSTGRRTDSDISGETLRVVPCASSQTYPGYSVSMDLMFKSQRILHSKAQSLYVTTCICVLWETETAWNVFGVSSMSYFYKESTATWRPFAILRQQQHEV